MKNYSSLVKLHQTLREIDRQTAQKILNTLGESVTVAYAITFEIFPSGSYGLDFKTIDNRLGRLTKNNDSYILQYN